MKSKATKIRLGVLVVVTTLILLVAAYLIGSRQNLFEETFKLKAAFSNVNGLQQGNNVRFSGINVGVVSQIGMINDSMVMVRMRLEKEIQPFIKSNAIATIGSDGLVGNMIVNIVPQAGEASAVKDGEEISSFSPIATDDLLKTLNVTNENAALLTADLLKVTRSLLSGQGTLGTLLKDTVMAGDLKQSIANLKTATERTNRSLQRFEGWMNELDNREGLLYKLTADPETAKEADSILSNLAAGGQKLNGVLDDLDTLVNSLGKEGGTLHYLNSDTTMTKRLERIMINVEGGTRSFEENMEALRHHWLFRKYFRKMEKEAENNGG
ncbi:MlaD family protein [Robertkochia aurantiaca]|uniref:MlaD family protein n=1 Tax=Robertkochia aurantiaca TaxID=2873700 RepID=UPI001CCC2414|nr:MlaD family protein [Robertkochia sp. 3YJGBD-33]